MRVASTQRAGGGSSPSATSGLRSRDSASKAMQCASIVAMYASLYPPEVVEAPIGGCAGWRRPRHIFDAPYAAGTESGAPAHADAAKPTRASPSTRLKADVEQSQGRRARLQQPPAHPDDGLLDVPASYFSTARQSAVTPAAFQCRLETSRRRSRARPAAHRCDHTWFGLPQRT